mgnify:CR=1 FL=1
MILGQLVPKLGLARLELVKDENLQSVSVLSLGESRNDVVPSTQKTLKRSETGTLTFDRHQVFETEEGPTSFVELVPFQNCEVQLATLDESASASFFVRQSSRQEGR